MKRRTRVREFTLSATALDDAIMVIAAVRPEERARLSTDPRAAAVFALADAAVAADAAGIPVVIR